MRVNLGRVRTRAGRPGLPASRLAPLVVGATLLLAGPIAAHGPVLAGASHAQPDPARDSGQVTFEVVPATPTAGPPTPTPSPTGGGLPVTGSGPDIGWLAITGGTLVLFGALLILVLVMVNRRLARERNTVHGRSAPARGPE